MIPYVIAVVIHSNDADGAQRPPVFRSKVWTLVDRWKQEKRPRVQWFDYYRGLACRDLAGRIVRHRRLGRLFVAVVRGGPSIFDRPNQ